MAGLDTLGGGGSIGIGKLPLGIKLHHVLKTHQSRPTYTHLKPATTSLTIAATTLAA
jgi:hypothetical protein